MVSSNKFRFLFIILYADFIIASNFATNSDVTITVVEDDNEIIENEVTRVRDKDLKVNNDQKRFKDNKKGQQVMLHVTINGQPNRHTTEQITNSWLDSFYDANLECQKFLVSDDSALFITNDGSLAWEMKEFLIKQDRCDYVKIDNETFNGKRYYKNDL